jgi:hypothetical protein
MRTQKEKTRYAVLIEAPKVDRSYGSSGAFWELNVVRIDAAKESPRNCARDSWERPEERMFDDLNIRCYYSWYDDKFQAHSYTVEYKNVYSVDLNCAEILMGGLKRVQKIVSAFPVQPESFGQFVCLVAAGLGVKECVRKHPATDGRRNGNGMYSDYTWQVLPIGSAQRIVDEHLDAVKEQLFPSAEVA